MAFQNATQVKATQLEQVRKKFAELLFNNESKFMKMFNNKSEKHQVSAWGAGTVGSGGVSAWRIPVLDSNGGDYQGIDLNAGDLGQGSMLDTKFMTVGYFSNDLAYGIPALAIMATKTEKQAMNNTLKMSLGRCFKELALYNEIGFFQDGTGVLATGAGTGSPVVSGGLVTYNLESTAFSFLRLRGKNALVDAYTVANVQSQLGSRVSSLNLSLSAPTVTLSVTGSPTVVNTDQIAFPGMGGTIGSSTIAAGSWRNGLYTFSTTNTTGSLLGLAYSDVYELQCNAVNGSGGFYTPSLIFSGKTQQGRRRDEDTLDGVVGVCNWSQRVSWYLQGLTISNQYVRNGEAVKSIDTAGQGNKYGDTFEAGDVTHYVSKFANLSRVDWVKPSDWGWVQLEDIDFYRTSEGQKVFVGRSSTTGNPLAAEQFYLINTRNLYNVDPGLNVVFYNLSIPAGQ